MKIVGVIQARLKSSRIENKMLLPCWQQKALIECVLSRVSKAKIPEHWIIAMPQSDRTGKLVKIINDAEVSDFSQFFGSQDDVVLRLLGAAKSSSATHLVRVCADNPFIDPVLIDELCVSARTSPHSYLYNHRPLKSSDRIYDGFGAEIISVKVLEKLYVEATCQDQKEHMTSLIMANLGSLEVEQLKYKTMGPIDLKLDIDTRLDYQRMKFLFESSNLHTPYIELVKIIQTRTIMR